MGGLFRHVLDLAEAQSEEHDVGLITGDLAAWPGSADTIERIRSLLSLGVHSFSMSRTIAANEFANLRAIRELLRKSDVDVAHGHGAKGGFYARLCARRLPTRSFYTPHGGSLHYSKAKITGRVFLGVESWLARMTDGFLFESEFAQREYSARIADPHNFRVVHNGLRESEFEPVDPSPEFDIGFIGELRQLKGVDVLLNAIADWPDERSPSLVVAGTGPDENAFRELTQQFGLTKQVSFIGRQPARAIFPKARVFVLPSRAESLPYVALELLAARRPLIATNVGGIAEIFADQSHRLVEPDNVKQLKDSLVDALRDLERFDAALAAGLRRSPCSVPR